MCQTQKKGKLTDQLWIDYVNWMDLYIRHTLHILPEVIIKAAQHINTHEIHPSHKSA